MLQGRSGSVPFLKEGPTLATGTVKRFDEKKGYGFITPSEGGRDVFFHHSTIEGTGFKTAREGEQVEYEAIQDPRGPRATRVKRVTP